MKNEYKLAVISLGLIALSFFAGYSFSPDNKKIEEQEIEIQQLKQLVVEQQAMFQSSIKSLANFKISKTKE